MKKHAQYLWAARPNLPKRHIIIIYQRYVNAACGTQGRVWVSDLSRNEKLSPCLSCLAKVAAGRITNPENQPKE